MTLRRPPYPTAGRELGMLPLAETIEDLGGGPPVTVVPGLPGYPRMVRAVFDRLGWNAERFHGLRLRIRYPPTPALAVLRYELPEQGT